MNAAVQSQIVQAPARRESERRRQEHAQLQALAQIVWLQRRRDVRAHSFLAPQYVPESAE
jgi:c-di-GMP-binding flagellar brake protein YcgR